ncbi:MAG: radical SAM protein, partial [Thermoproteota archaeon]
FDSVDYDLPPGERAAGIRGFPYSQFLRSLDALTEAGPARVVPHILLGLPGVRPEDELSAIEEASSRGYDELVLLVFIPTEGTPFEGMNPPSISRILPVVREARRIFGGELSLGCMRPKVLKRTLDPAVVEEGLVDRIAVPRPELVERGGLETVAACCAVPRSEFSRFPRGFLP